MILDEVVHIVFIVSKIVVTTFFREIIKYVLFGLELVLALM